MTDQKNNTLTQIRATAPLEARIALLEAALGEAWGTLETARPVLSRAMKQAHTARTICGSNTPQEREAIEAAQAARTTLASLSAMLAEGEPNGST